MKVKLRGDLKPEVLEYLKKILIKHKVEWEVEEIYESENKQEQDKRFVENRKGSFEI